MPDPTGKALGESREIRGASLRDCGIEADGARIRLGLLDAAGLPADVTLPAECLAQLVMTLPALAAEALRRRYRDPSLRLVYPLGDWRLEATPDGARRILTLSTEDGFAVSFVLPPERLAAMADAATQRPAPLRPH
ncbi:hypothetical protein [Belnapia rosea]|uniref:Uncharacterized protein n=1 Tax=Belnapia rosea TaxID=938405 RepID=A0A1G6XWD9_9PROT|nr:hypothetical protein [Belnapia rosea]SDB72905.1 hypothetical protein SAMN02927895_04592 [Belnapia rosea]SDD82489.1 hypothetical protein SAMN04487779_101312 [Belnapia rosea]